jgi:hypothetical protein
MVQSSGHRDLTAGKQKDRVKIVPVLKLHTLKPLGGSGGIVSCFFNLGTRWS